MVPNLFINKPAMPPLRRCPMKIPETLLEVLKKDGVVAIATQGPDGPHLVNTWHSYVQVRRRTAC